jgi:acetylornithine aminotransferase
LPPNAFHGRTMGSLALTGQPSKQAPFEPLPGYVTHVPYGDIDALAGRSPMTAAVFLEPIMGRAASSCRPPATWWPPARSPPRTAPCWSSTRSRPVSGAPERSSPTSDGVTPDIVTLAKGLGGGLPIGACLAIGPPT